MIMKASQFSYFLKYEYQWLRFYVLRSTLFYQNLCTLAGRHRDDPFFSLSFLCVCRTCSVYVFRACVLRDQFEPALRRRLGSTFPASRGFPRETSASREGSTVVYSASSSRDERV